MQAQQEYTQQLFNTIQQLPPEKVALVDDFVELLKSRGQKNDLGRMAGKLSEKSFQKAWDNPEDAGYDNL
ncbi:MAG TPA: toxin-antitoxin system, antitoxin component, Xre family protein [Desulfobulbus sp.]|nr:toxin-antitoxin system, antitoxin component, Xre family protein [Desulfobulbus sp.]